MKCTFRILILLFVVLKNMFFTSFLATFFIYLIRIHESHLTDPIPLKLGVHLFVDNKYIQNISSLEFQNGLIQKNTNDPIIFPEYPWEAAVYFYTSFVQVPAELSITSKPMFLIYYGCASADTIIYFDEVHVCVASSSDGLIWEKPKLWYYPYQENQTQSVQPTNRIFKTEVNEFIGAVFIDTHPGIPRSEVFKMTYENEPVRYVYVATSSDGFNWTAGTEPVNPIRGLADTQTVMLYSPENGGEYVLYGRRDLNIPNSTVECPGATSAFRRVMVVVSNDSIYGPWTDQIEAFQLGAPDPIQCFDNYNPATLYYKDVYFLFPSGFRHWTSADSGAPPPLATAYDGVMEIRLAVSRTAIGPFIFPTRDPFIPRGIGDIDPISKILNATGSDRDTGLLFASANGLFDPDFLLQSSSSDADENPSAWMYHLYWGSQTTHGSGAYLGRYWPGAFSGIFKARIRREGYVALSTSPSNPTGYGSLLTQILSLPSINSQLQMKINAEIATAGFVQVQFEDGITGNPISGYTFNECKQLHGNGIRQLLEWSRQNGTIYSSDLSSLINYPGGIRIRINMVHTKLYSWFLSSTH